jgi:copper chaperone CopZ
MKTKSVLIALFTVTLVVNSWAGNKKVVFNVSMHCESCQKKIEKNIAFEKGVKDLEVNLPDKTVAVTFDEAKTNAEKLKTAFKKIGYEATEQEPACEKTNAAEGKSCCKDDADAKKCDKPAQGQQKSDSDNVQELSVTAHKGCCK